MKRFLALFLLAASFAVAAPVNVQRVGGAGADANDVTTSLAIPSGKTLDVSAGTLTLADGQVAEAKVANLTTDLALKAPLISPVFTGTITIGNGVSLGYSGSGTINATTLATYTPATLPVSTAMQTALDTKKNYLTGTTANTNVVFEGDSLSDVGFNPPRWPTVLMGLSSFSGRATPYYRAVSGSKISDLIARYATDVYPHRPQGAVTKSILFVPIGTNDVGVTDPNTFIASWNSYISTAIADGFTVVAATIPRSGTAQTGEADRQIMNRAISESEYPIQVLDLSAMFPFPGTEPYYTGDKIHQNAVGGRYIADKVNKIFEASADFFLRQKPTDTLAYMPAISAVATGVSGYGAYTNPVTPSTAAFSFGGWLNYDASTAGNAYLSYGTSAGLTIGPAPAVTGGLVVEGMGLASSNIPFPFSDKTWYFIYMTRTSGGLVSIYINGRLIHSESTTSANLGAINVVLNNGVKGRVAELSYFNAALSGQEILNLYNTGGHPPSSSANLVFNVPFNDGAGTTARGYGTDVEFVGSNLVWSNAPVPVQAGTLIGTTLASNVVASSLTSVGTLTSLNVSSNSFAPDLNANSVVRLSGAYGGGVTFIDGSSITGMWLSASGNNFNVKVGGSTSGFGSTNGQFVFTNTGCMGIGTFVPGSALDVVGTVTATAFSGPLTGNVTGNVSGSSGSTTGNAATATALATARAINGVDFNGTAPINVPVYNARTTGTTSFTAAVGVNTFTGSTAAQTVTLPAPTSTGTIFFKNQSSVSVTLASASGSQIFTSSAQASITVLSGDSVTLWPDGTYWNQ